MLLKDVRVKDMLVNDIPVKPQTTNGDLAKNVSVEAAPVKAARVMNALVKDVPVKDLPVKDEPLHVIPLNDPYVREPRGTIRVGTLRNHISVSLATAANPLPSLLFDRAEEDAESDCVQSLPAHIIGSLQSTSGHAAVSNHPSSVYPSTSIDCQNSPTLSNGALATGEAEVASPEQAESPSMQNVLSVPWLSRNSAEDRRNFRSRRSLFQELGRPRSSQRVLAEGGHSPSSGMERSEGSQFIYEPAEWRNMANNSRVSLGFSDLAERVESMHSVLSEQSANDSGDSSRALSKVPSRDNSSAKGLKMASDGGSANGPEELNDGIPELQALQHLPKPLPRVESQGSIDSSDDSDFSELDGSAPQSPDSVRAAKLSEGSLSIRKSPSRLPPPLEFPPISESTLIAQVEEFRVVRSDTGVFEPSRSNGQIEDALSSQCLPKPLKPLRSSEEFAPLWHSTFSAPVLGRRSRSRAPSFGAGQTPLDLNSDIFELGNSSRERESFTAQARTSPDGSVDSSPTSSTKSMPSTVSMPSLGRRPLRKAPPGLAARPYSARRRTKHSLSPSGDRNEFSAAVQSKIKGTQSSAAEPRSLPSGKEWESSAGLILKGGLTSGASEDEEYANVHGALSMTYVSLSDERRQRLFPAFDAEPQP